MSRMAGAYRRQNGGKKYRLHLPLRMDQLITFVSHSFYLVEVRNLENDDHLIYLNN